MTRTEKLPTALEVMVAGAGYKSMAAFLREVGITPQARWDWKASRGSPRPMTLVRLTAKLGCTTDQILDALEAERKAWEASRSA